MAKKKHKKSIEGWAAAPFWCLDRLRETIKKNEQDDSVFTASCQSYDVELFPNKESCRNYNKQNIPKHIRITVEEI